MEPHHNRRSIGYAVLFLALLALSTAAISPATAQSSAVTPNVFAAVVDAPTLDAARAPATCGTLPVAIAQGQSASVMYSAAALPPQSPSSSVCCSWSYWCDYYYCYYSEYCWYC